MPASLKRVLYAVFLVATVALVGFRDSSMGFDTITYEKSFGELLENKPLSDNFEIGYLVLVEFFQLFSSNFNLFLFLVAAASVGIKFYAVPRYSPLIFIPLAYYMAYYLTEYEMSAIRQSLAIAFGFLAIYYAKTRKLPVFIAVILIGSMFHVSLLFFFPFYFLNRVRINITHFAILIASSAVLFVVDLSSIIWKVIGFIPAGSIVAVKVTAYLEGNTQTGLTLGHLPYLLFASFFFYYGRVVKDEFFQHLLAAFIIGLFFSFFFSSTLGVLNRLTYYYLMTGGFLFAYIIHYSRHNINKIAYLLMLSAFMILKIMESILAGEARPHYIPYQTFF